MPASTVRSIIFVALALCLTGAGARAGETETVKKSPMELRQVVLPIWTSGVEGAFAPGPIIWGGFNARWSRGFHVVEVNGDTISAPEWFAFGDPVATGAFFTSATYSYRGLFGGIVRPVARLSAGIGQGRVPVGGAGFLGYADAYGAYASTEAGVEIVYHGYGVGMTAGYVVPIDISNPAGDVTGPPSPTHVDPGKLDFDDLLKRVYLIVE